MRNNQKVLKATLIPALGYGLGFVMSVVIIKLIFDSGLLDSVANLFENQHLTAGIIILFLVVLFGGALAGGIGGLSLWYGLSLDNWKRPVSRSAVGFGFGFGIVLIPIVVLLASLSMYNAGGSSPAGFVVSMGVVGVIFGFVSGVMTATLPQRGNYWRVTGILSLAFGVGGLAFGFGLWNYFYALYETGAGTAELLFSFFIFGAVGGLVMGLLFHRDLEEVAHEEDEDGAPHTNIFYRGGQWFRSTKFYKKRGFWGTLIFLALLFLLTRLIAMSPLNFSDASLSETLPLDSIGVHWSEAWNVAKASADVSQSDIAQSADLLAIAWVQENEVFYTTSSGVDGVVRIWQPPVKLSGSAGSTASNPQVSDRFFGKSSHCVGGDHFG